MAAAKLKLAFPGLLGISHAEIVAFATVITGFSFTVKVYKVEFEHPVVVLVAKNLTTIVPAAAPEGITNEVEILPIELKVAPIPDV